MEHFLTIPNALIPDAMIRWQTFLDAYLKQETEVISEIDSHADMIKAVFAFSEFVYSTCLKNPGLLKDLLHTGDLSRSYEQSTYTTIIDNRFYGFTDLPDLVTIQQILRRIRAREMVRIAWRDLLGWSGFEETTRDLSALASACLDKSVDLLYRILEQRYGTPLGSDNRPQSLVVIGMGKLGAGELNFSSDVDLIFAYPENGHTQGADESITNKEFFTRLCRDLLKVIGQNTLDGIVFRVDTGLRPYGNSGPIVMSFDAMVNYYQAQGREWERYAWIKASVSAGDPVAGQELLNRLAPFIYRRYLDYAIFDSIRDMKQRIVREVTRNVSQGDIKLGAGGIREVEFFGQVFQLIRGGIDPELQESRIRNVLCILSEKGLIPSDVQKKLDAAYVFLRNVEHRIQEFTDRQTHHLPSNPKDQLRLAVAMGFDDWASFKLVLNAHMKTIHRQFNQLLKTDTSSDNAKPVHPLEGVWDNLEVTPENRELLAQYGFDEPEEVINILKSLRNESYIKELSPDVFRRFQKLIPLILEETAASGDPQKKVLTRIIELIRAIRKRSCYLSLIIENPDVMTRLVQFASASSWILTYVSQHPLLLDELLDPRVLYDPPGIEQLRQELCRKMKQVPADDLELQMEQLRVFKQVNILRLAGADIANAISLMRISDHLSDLATVILDEVIELSWNHLVNRHGKPVCTLDDQPVEKGFAVIAYGKLGGLELSYTSDLDLVFLHAGTHEQTSGSTNPIDSSYFFARLGQRMVHILSSRTANGVLYEADMRLRPDGSGGVLVSHIDVFHRYQVEKAWTWEKQALTRARAVCGDPVLLDRFNHVRLEVLTQEREVSALRKDITEMRQRLREEHLNYQTDDFDLKHGDGGIVDIEFLVQYLVLRHAHQHPELITWTDNVRQIQTLAQVGIITDVTAYFLRKAYLCYRTMGHKLSLQDQPAKVPGNTFTLFRRLIRSYWKKYLKISNQPSSRED